MFQRMITPENLQKNFSSYDTKRENHRHEKRELWYKIILLSSAILGFSVTLFSSEYLENISGFVLKICWFVFIINIISGLYLLTKESDFEHASSTAKMFEMWDRSELPMSLEKEEDRNKFLALTYLHTLRTVSPREKIFSDLTISIFERVKKELTSWKSISDPKNFYSYSHLKEINVVTEIFYTSFIVALILLILSVII